MPRFIKDFFSNEDGAVTVDWVVLTAAIVGLGVGTIMTVGDATDAVADSISDGLINIEVGGSNPASGS